MKHDFEAFTPQNPMLAMQVYGARKCKNCGQVQYKYGQQVWMRVTGYRWEPLIGRCKPVLYKLDKGENYDETDEPDYQS